MRTNIGKNKDDEEEKEKKNDGLEKYRKTNRYNTTFVKGNNDEVALFSK